MLSTHRKHNSVTAMENDKNRRPRKSEWQKGSDAEIERPVCAVRRGSDKDLVHNSSEQEFPQLLRRKLSAIWLQSPV